MQVGWAKVAFYDRSIRNLRLRRLTAENVSIRHVVRVHDGALAEEYVVSSAFNAPVKNATIVGYGRRTM